MQFLANGASGLVGQFVQSRVLVVIKLVLERVLILYLLTVVVSALDNRMELRLATTNIAQVNVCLTNKMFNWRLVLLIIV